ncbi:MAG: hypothetical protein IT463_05445 [Planctomycetes bacterium]|nr:hypothetical protein [Planctomycetota bacterium]
MLSPRLRVLRGTLESSLRVRPLRLRRVLPVSGTREEVLRGVLPEDERIVGTPDDVRATLPLLPPGSDRAEGDELPLLRKLEPDDERVLGALLPPAAGALLPRMVEPPLEREGVRVICVAEGAAGAARLEPPEPRRLLPLEGAGAGRALPPELRSELPPEGETDPPLEPPEPRRLLPRPPEVRCASTVSGAANAVNTSAAAAVSNQFLGENIVASVLVLQAPSNDKRAPRTVRVRGPGCHHSEQPPLHEHKSGLGSSRGDGREPRIERRNEPVGTKQTTTDCG